MEHGLDDAVRMLLYRNPRKRRRLPKETKDENSCATCGITLGDDSQSDQNNKRIQVKEPMIRGGFLPNESRNRPLVWKKGDYVTSDKCRYVLRRLLGSGSYGTVIKAWNATEGTLVALKFFHKLQPSSREPLEVSMLRRLTEKNLHHLFGLPTDVFRHNTYNVVTMDILAEDLHKQFQGKHVSPRMIRPIAQQVLEALVELARLDIIHGDMKPMNIMLVDCKHLKVKVIDFSCSDYAFRTQNNQPPMTAQTRYYRAPEIIMGSSCTPQVDMWSLAHTLAMLYSGGPIFKGYNSYYMMRYFTKVFGLPTQEQIASGKHRQKLFIQGTDGIWRLKGRAQMKASHPNFIWCNDPSLPQSAYDIATTTRCTNADFCWRFGTDLQAAVMDFNSLADLLTKMFVYDPEERITPEEALKHPFITLNAITDPVYTSTAYFKGARNMMMQTCADFTKTYHPEWFMVDDLKSPTIDSPF